MTTKTFNYDEVAFSKDVKLEVIESGSHNNVTLLVRDNDTKTIKEIQVTELFNETLINTATTEPTKTDLETLYPNLKAGQGVYYPNLDANVCKKYTYLSPGMYIEEIINILQ